MTAGALDRLAARLNRKRGWPFSWMQFHGLAGAVYWIDEFPLPWRFKEDEENFVRLLLRFRTTLVLGNPDAGLQPYWEAGQRMFPRWVGFSARRLKPTPEFVAYYSDASERFEKMFMEAIDEKL